MKTLLLVLAVFALGFNSGYRHQQQEEPDDGSNAVIADLQNDKDRYGREIDALIELSRNQRCQPNEFNARTPILTGVVK